MAPSAVASSKSGVAPICLDPAQTWQPLLLWPKAKVGGHQPDVAEERTASHGTLERLGILIIAGHPLTHHPHAAAG